MKIKVEKIGFIAKDKNIETILKNFYLNEYIYATKGEKDEWLGRCWPPKKVKITVEVID